MVKQNKWRLLITSVFILLPILVGVIGWNALPEQVATHWNAAGEPDGYSPRAFAVFFLPLFFLGAHWVCLLVTAVDPKNRGRNNKVVRLVLWICPVLSWLSCGMIYLSAWGVSLSVDKFPPLFMGLLFLLVGNYLPKCQQNYTIGIKLPWTLHNEENWNRTHRMTGHLWIAGGLVMMVCVFLPAVVGFWVCMALVFLLVVIPTVYSYCLHRQGY